MTARRRGALVALFAIYLALLVWMVLWKMHVPFIGRDDMREIKLIPFAPSGTYGASSPDEVLANLLVFLPFGAYLSALAPAWPAWRSIAIVAGASLALEVGQYILATGSSDVTDLLVNAAGGAAGAALLTLARRRLDDRAVTLMLGICLAGTVVAVVAAGLFITHLPQPGSPGSGGPTISWAPEAAVPSR